MKYNDEQKKERPASENDRMTDHQQDIQIDQGWGQTIEKVHCLFYSTQWDS